MRRTLEVFFRYPLRFLIFLVVLPMVGVAVIYVMVPRTYQTTASLWAFHRYAVIGATGPEADLTSTPAQTQATALSELLQTRAFVDTVVKGIDLAPTLNLDSTTTDNPQLLEDALFNDLSKNVVVTPQAYNLFAVSYTNANPYIARQVVASIISQYGAQSLDLSIAEGRNLLASYQQQLATAQKSANDAAAAEASYVSAHPTSQLANDPQLANLDATRVQAQLTVQNIQATINTIEQSIGAQGTNVSSLFQVLDPPQLPDRPVSRLKSYLLGGGAGLALALLADTLFLVILVRRDHTIYSAVELQHIIAPPVVMQLPNLSLPTISLLIPNTAREQLVRENK